MEEGTDDAEFNELALLRLIRQNEIEEGNRVLKSGEEDLSASEK